jgi:hypothetical protein
MVFNGGFAMRRYYLHIRKGVYYAELVTPEGRKLSARSTRKTTEDEALLVVAEWLKNGVPTGRTGAPRPADVAMGLDGILRAIRKTGLNDHDAMSIVRALKDRGLAASSINKDEPEFRLQKHPGEEGSGFGETEQGFPVVDSQAGFIPKNPLARGRLCSPYKDLGFGKARPHHEFNEFFEHGVGGDNIEFIPALRFGAEKRSYTIALIKAKAQSPGANDIFFMQQMPDKRMHTGIGGIGPFGKDAKAIKGDNTSAPAYGLKLPVGKIPRNISHGAGIAVALQHRKPCFRQYAPKTRFVGMT